MLVLYIKAIAIAQLVESDLFWFIFSFYPLVHPFPSLWLNKTHLNMCYVPRWIRNVNWRKEKRYNLFPLSNTFTAKYSALKWNAIKLLMMVNRKSYLISLTLWALCKNRQKPMETCCSWCRFHNMLSVSYWFCCLSVSKDKA